MTPKQLQASSGQVRCGRCQSVFDAFATLSAKFPTAAPIGDDLPGPAPRSASAGIESTERSRIADAPAAVAEALTSALPAEAAERLPDPGETTQQNQGRKLADEPSAKSSSREAEPDEARPRADPPTTRDDFRPLPDPGRGLGLAEDVMLPAPPDGRRRAFLLANALLSILAALQAIWVFATPMAIAAPALRPALEGLCGILLCSVALPRLPDQLSIEASELQMVTPGRVNEVLLTATIRNRAAVAQQYPLPPEDQPNLTGIGPSPGRAGSASARRAGPALYRACPGGPGHR